MRVFMTLGRLHLDVMATATNYEPMMSVLEARARYFADNAFGDDGGYNDRWVTLYKLGPIPLGFPNTAGRIAAVRYHDLHHLATGYDTDILGEAEIAAWELASGCTKFLAAWVLNTLALPVGALRNRERIERAFARGCRTRNLYSEPVVDNLLDERLGALRERLGMTRASNEAMTTAERRRYRRALVVGVVLDLAVLAVLAVLLAAVVLGVAWLLRG
jgi:hypothetical protein